MQTILRRITPPVIFLIPCFIPILASGQMPAELPSEIGIGLHLGAMFTADEEIYFGEGTDLYPEIALYRRYGLWSIGGTVGLIWRELTRYGVFTGVVYSEEEILIFPVMARLDIHPFARVGSATPFIGVGGGYYLAVEGQSSRPAFALRVGADVAVSDSGTLRFEIRSERTLGDPQLGGIMVTAGGYLTF